MSKIKKLIFIFVLVMAPVLAVSSALPPSVSASSDAGKEACEGLESLGVDCNADGKSADEIASQPIKSLINTLSIIIGLIAVIMIIYGGLKFVTSGGDSDGVKAARNTIIYAAVGLAVVLLAQTIVFFVFRKSVEIQARPVTPPTSIPDISI